MMAVDRREVSGLTLIELLVVVSAMTLLAMVLWAPVKQTSDLRSAALTISRLHKLLDLVNQYRIVNGDWPKSSGNCVNIGGDGPSSVVFGDYNANAPVTGWGNSITASCPDDDYELTYIVPDTWVTMFKEQLEETEWEGPATEGWSSMKTITDRYGNDKFGIQYGRSARLEDGDVDVYKSVDCDGNANANVMALPMAVCRSTGDDDVNVFGFRFDPVDNDGYWRFEVKWLHFDIVQQTVPGGTTTTPVERRSESSIFNRCDNRRPRLRMITQCIKPR